MYTVQYLTIHHTWEDYSKHKQKRSAITMKEKITYTHKLILRIINNQGEVVG